MKLVVSLLFLVAATQVFSAPCECEKFWDKFKTCIEKLVCEQVNKCMKGAHKSPEVSSSKTSSQILESNGSSSDENSNSTPVDSYVNEGDSMGTYQEQSTENEPPQNTKVSNYDNQVDKVINLNEAPKSKDETSDMPSAVEISDDDIHVDHWSNESSDVASQSSDNPDVKADGNTESVTIPDAENAFNDANKMPSRRPVFETDPGNANNGGEIPSPETKPVFDREVIDHSDNTEIIDNKNVSEISDGGVVLNDEDNISSDESEIDSTITLLETSPVSKIDPANTNNDGKIQSFDKNSESISGESIDMAIEENLNDKETQNSPASTVAGNDSNRVTENLNDDFLQNQENDRAEPIREIFQENKNIISNVDQPPNKSEPNNSAQDPVSTDSELNVQPSEINSDNPTTTSGSDNPDNTENIDILEVTESSDDGVISPIKEERPNQSSEKSETDASEILLETSPVSETNTANTNNGYEMQNSEKNSQSSKESETDASKTLLETSTVAENTNNGDVIQSSENNSESSDKSETDANKILLETNPVSEVNTANTNNGDATQSFENKNIQEENKNIKESNNSQQISENERNETDEIPNDNTVKESNSESPPIDEEFSFQENENHHNLMIFSKSKPIITLSGMDQEPADQEKVGRLKKSGLSIS